MKRMWKWIGALGVLAVLAGAGAQGSGATGREVFLANGCAHTELEVRPHTIGVSCDRTFEFYGINWKHWGRRAAVGIGHARLQGCTPACAEGRVTRPRAVLRLTHVVTVEGIWIFARLDYSLSGPLPSPGPHRGTLRLVATASDPSSPDRVCDTDLPGTLSARDIPCSKAHGLISSYARRAQIGGPHVEDRRIPLQFRLGGDRR